MSKISYEKIADGIAIYKPIKSRFWWCRVRIDNHPSIKEIRQSLKTEEKNRAIYEAQKIAFQTEVKIKENIDLITSKPFVDKIALKTLKRIENKKPFKQTYKGYLRVLEKEIIPFFEKNKLKIDELDRFEIEKFFIENEKRSQTQINITKTCFKHIFEEALREKVIKEKDIPKMPKIERTEQEEKRDFFNETELATVIMSFDDFIESSRKEITKHNRFLLMCCCYWLAGTGTRPGNECLFTWNDLEIVKKDNVEILTCNIKKGKTSKKGGRKIVLDIEAFTALELIAQYRESGIDSLSNDLPLSPYFQYVIKFKSKIDIFKRLEDIKEKYGNEIVLKRYDNKLIDFTKTFEFYIKHLRKHKKINEKNHTLYSFRHTYITLKLLNKEGAEQWTAEQVATQCGNSLQMIWNFYLHLQSLDKVFNFKYYNEIREKLKETGA